jgi:hypothetical protein
MKDLAITATRDFDRAAQRLHDLERYADRRDQLLERLYLDSLGRGELSRIFAEDDQIDEELAWVTSNSTTWRRWPRSASLTPDLRHAA